MVDTIHIENIMTVLGSILDEDCLTSVYDGIARFEVSDYVSKLILDNISGIENTDDYVCDVLLEMKIAEIVGIRIIKKDEEYTENISVEVNTDNPLYKLICEHLACYAQTKFLSDY